MKKGALVSSLAMAPAARVGRWGGVGTRESPAPQGWMAKGKNARNPGSKVFLGTEKKAEKEVLLLTGVRTCTMSPPLPRMGGKRHF